MKLKPLQMPKSVEIAEENETYGKFIITPLERGFGYTFGVALRRILISSIQGTAITRVQIDGVEHEFTSIPGVMEDVVEILMRLKKVRIKSDADLPAMLELSKKGPGKVKAGDIWTPMGVEIVNKDCEICSLGKNGSIKMEMEVTSGVGYCPSERLKTKTSPVGAIFVDAIYSPVSRVVFDIQNTRVGNRSDYDKLILEIYTDGTMTPLDALSHAGKILKDHAEVMINFEKEPEVIVEPEIDEEKRRMQKLLSQKVEELELSVRAANCLKEAEIKTLGDLVQKTEQEMLKYKNFGKRSLQELIKVLEGKGLQFGIDISEYMDEEKSESKDET